MSDLLDKKFPPNWSHALSTKVDVHKFGLLGKHIAELRKTKIIYPDSNEVFRAFELTDYNSIKVVLLGQDPYHNGTADGLAFSGSKCNTSCPKSLHLMLKEIERSKTIYSEEIFVGKLDPWDLSRWAKQGVLLLNTSLTVEEGKPNSHKVLWTPFIKQIILTINELQDIVWLLLGNEAKAFSPLITNTTHQIVETYHPAADLYSGENKFYGSNCFVEVNECLSKVNKKYIIW
jgi:uracil-DNA glycosylase